MATKTPVRPVHEDDEPLLGIPPEPPVRKRRSYAWLWLLVLAVAAYGAYRYYQNTHAKHAAAAPAQGRNAQPRVIPVVASPARSGDMPVFLRGLGTVTPFNNVTVKSRVDGQLMAIHFTEGQYVNKGDLLAEIDPRPFEVQLAQAQGQLARDQAQLSDAQANLGRYEALWKEQVIARQQLDTQRATVGPVPGRARVRPRRHRQRPAAAHLRQDHGPHQRPRRVCVRSTSATSSTPPMPTDW